MWEDNWDFDDTDNVLFVCDPANGHGCRGFVVPKSDASALTEDKQARKLKVAEQARKLKVAHFAHIPVDCLEIETKIKEA